MRARALTTQHNRVGDDDDRDEADPRARALSPLFAIAEISFPFSFFSLRRLISLFRAELYDVL